MLGFVFVATLHPLDEWRAARASRVFDVPIPATFAARRNEHRRRTREDWTLANATTLSYDPKRKPASLEDAGERQPRKVCGPKAHGVARIALIASVAPIRDRRAHFNVGVSLVVAIAGASQRPSRTRGEVLLDGTERCHRVARERSHDEGNACRTTRSRIVEAFLAQLHWRLPHHGWESSGQRSDRH
jgi:hypothetical protein